MMRLVIGTRGSLLARTQSEWVAGLLRCLGHEVALEVLVTRGDREQSRPLPEIGGKGLFTAELEEALRAGRIDLAVHSLKDLPTEPAEGLVLAAVPQRVDPRDALVSRGPGLMELPPGARVGTASLRRRALLRARRRDLDLQPLRGNVDTRLAKVAGGELDAVVLAAAGLIRLGRESSIVERLDFLPAPGQGALAVQAAEGRSEVRAALAAIHDRATELCVQAERHLLHRLGGGCSVPVGAWATLDGTGCLALRALVARPEGTEVLEARAEGGDPEAVAAQAAGELLAQGAGEILHAAE